MTARYMAAARGVRYSRDSWVNIRSMGSIDQVVSDIQQTYVVRMRGSGTNLRRGKHLSGVSDPAYQICTQSTLPFSRYSNGMCDRQVVHVPFPPSPYGSDPLYGVSLSTWCRLPSTHPPNFSPIAAIGKKLIFYRFMLTEIQQKYVVRMRDSDTNLRCAKHLSGGQ